MRLAALLALLSGCTFARVRYHDGAASSAVLACFPGDEDPHALECWPYLQVKATARERSVEL
jgi:hypothetical protein